MRLICLINILYQEEVNAAIISFSYLDCLTANNCLLSFQNKSTQLLPMYGLVAIINHHNCSTGIVSWTLQILLFKHTSVTDELKISINASLTLLFLIPLKSIYLRSISVYSFSTFILHLNGSTRERCSWVLWKLHKARTSWRSSGQISHHQARRKCHMQHLTKQPSLSSWTPGWSRQSFSTWL